VPTVHANGIGLYYEELGSGIPILCIHGTSGSALVWANDAREIAKHGRAIIYDRRGSFRSDRPEPYETTDVRDHADDSAALLDALSATPAVVIGRSYGGQVALDLARRFPLKVTALALLEPAMFSLVPEAMAWGKRFAEKVLKAGARDVSSVAEVLLRATVGDEVWESFPPELKEMFVGNGPAILAEVKGRTSDLDVTELARINHPTLIVSSKDSPEPFRRSDQVLAEALPNAETALVEGGHFISPAGPAVMDFVDRFAGPSP
jgi:pimeloyl-ACP methyl ester carboxylesterase